MRWTNTTTAPQSLPVFIAPYICVRVGTAPLPICVRFAGLWVILEQLRLPKAECCKKLPVSKLVLLVCQSQ